MSIGFGGSGHIAPEEHHYYRQDAAPDNADGRLQVGDLWSDTTNNLLKRCTGLSPISFVSTEGGSSSHDLFSATHGDVDETDTPADAEVLTWNNSAGKWEAQPAGGHAEDHAARHESGGADALTLASLASMEATAILVNTAANRPAAGTADRLFIETDTGRVLRDNGTSWDEMGLSESQIALANLATRAHSDLSDAPTNAHHNEDHSSRHAAGGGDQLDHFQLGGLTADNHHQRFHGSGHADGGNDEIAVQDLASDAATDGQVAKADGAGAVAFEDDVAALEFIIDGGGSAIATGVKGYLEIPFACEITQVTLLLDQSATVTIDIWKDTYANFPPTDADTITGANEPATSAALKDQDGTLTDWTTTIAAGDILGFNVDANDNATRVTVSLKVRKT